MLKIVKLMLCKVVMLTEYCAAREVASTVSFLSSTILHSGSPLGFEGKRASTVSSSLLALFSWTETK